MCSSDLSVDSMAVYRGLDVGTAKPGPEERARIPHHLLDVVGPDETYNVARWLSDVAIAIEGIRSRGRRILFVGGTPLYLRALRDGLAAVPGPVPDVRARLSLRPADVGDGYVLEGVIGGGVVVDEFKTIIPKLNIGNDEIGRAHV